MLLVDACGPAGGPKGELAQDPGARPTGRNNRSTSLDAGLDANGEPCAVPTLAAIADQIFTPRCAGSGCHAGAEPAAGLALDLPLETLATRLREPSIQSPSHMPLVTPGQIGASFLYLKVAFDPPLVGQAMPPDAALETCALGAIRRWIELGAS